MLLFAQKHGGKAIRPKKSIPPLWSDAFALSGG
jgi:hypothetical protein